MSEIAMERESGEAESTPRLNDCAPERQIELRYLNALGALLADALEHRSGHVLVNVLTWTLAKIAGGQDSVWVAGDIIRRLGDHVCTLSERRRTQEATEQRGEEANQPH